MLCPVYGHELTPLSCPPSQGVSFRSFKGLIILSPYMQIRLSSFRNLSRRRTGISALPVTQCVSPLKHVAPTMR